MKLEIKNGYKIGKLTVLKEASTLRLPSGQTNRVFVCLCDCGNEKNIRLLHLLRGRTLSCGCISKTRNGLGNTPLCKAWRSIKYRTSENYFERHLYFDKGITVCEEWVNSWESFKNWSLSNGYKEGLQIDRIDNSKGYYPENCRWVTCKINVNNRDKTIMVFYNLEKEPLCIVLDRLGKMKDYHTILRRIKRGWLHSLAIDTPIKKLKTKALN